MRNIVRRWLPAPLLSASLAALWLLLNPSLGAGNLLLAAGAAVLAPLLMARLRPQPVRMKRPWLLVRFVLQVGGDVVVSNLAVARGVLRAGRKAPRSAFVRVPLELRDPTALAALAVVTTVVPGTVWSELAVDRSALLLHVMEVGDEADFIAHFKQRYERPLKEIFE